jgi:DICT domain-containing protein
VKDFSFFEFANKFSQRPDTQDLGQISGISRRDFDVETVVFRCCGASVEYASLLIENALLLRTNRAGRIYAGFEKLSYLEPIIDRYIRIADLSESVFIFGEPDWTPPKHPNIRLIGLKPDYKLACEWFLIVDSSSLQVALVATDEDRLANPLLEKRTFRALKTSEPSAVTQLSHAAEGLIDWSIAA